MTLDEAYRLLGPVEEDQIVEKLEELRLHQDPRGNAAWNVITNHTGVSAEIKGADKEERSGTAYQQVSRLSKWINHIPGEE